MTASSQQTDSVPCPECGAAFTRRGLASHRRQMHGTRTVPRGERLLHRALEILESLDERVGAIEARMGDAARDREADLSLELERVVARAREVTAVLDELGEPTIPDEEHQTRVRELGDLRRVQAEILYRMGDAAPGGAFEESDTPLAF